MPNLDGTTGVWSSDQEFSLTNVAMSPSSPTTASAGMTPKLLTYDEFSRTAQSRRKSLDFHHIDSISIPRRELADIDVSKVPFWTSHRFCLAILFFFGFINLYAQRVNLSIAIVSMVTHHTKNVTHVVVNGSTITPKVDPKCPVQEHKNLIGEFQWSKKLTGLILGAFFWGYLLLQVAGGRMSEKYGAKKVIAFGMFPVSIFTLLSPMAARASPYLFMAVRVVIGLGEGVMYPAAQTIWSNWAPPNERSRLIGFSYAGGQFGNALIFPVAGFLSAHGFDGGWPSVFYVIGASGFLWCCLWVMFAHDTPDQDKGISDMEKNYINLAIGDKYKGRNLRGRVPWKAILTSRPVWAILIAHPCGNYGAYMLLTKLPAFMKEVLKFDIKSNGVLSMLPYLLFWFLITLSGILADYLISRKILSVANTRKLMSVLGMVIPAGFLTGVGFLECDQQVWSVVMIILAIGTCGFHFSGYFINHGDLAIPYAGTLFGLSNTLATIPGIVSPYIVSHMTPHGTREEWQKAFMVAAAIYVFGAFMYVLLGDGKQQTWAIIEIPQTSPEVAEVSSADIDFAQAKNPGSPDVKKDE